MFLQLIGWYCSYILPRQALTTHMEKHNKTLRQIGCPALYITLAWASAFLLLESRFHSVVATFVLRRVSPSRFIMFYSWGNFGGGGGEISPELESIISAEKASNYLSYLLREVLNYSNLKGMKDKIVPGGAGDSLRCWRGWLDDFMICSHKMSSVTAFFLYRKTCLPSASVCSTNFILYVSILNIK